MAIVRNLLKKTGFCSAPLFAVLAGLLVAACSSTHAEVPDSGAISGPISDRTTALPPVQNLGAGEKIRVTVFGEPQLSGEFVIDAAGNFAMPLIGPVAAAGMAPSAVEGAIASKLKGRYLVDPKVNVEVASYRPVYVLGEVKTSGEFPYTPGLNVVSAVALAGGFTPRASPTTVYIKRANAAAEQEVSLAANILVYPGDLIRVPERYF